MTPTIRTLLSDLKFVIKKENKHLKAGELVALSETVSLKETLLSRLQKIPNAGADRDKDIAVARDLETIGYLLKDNERLMKSAVNSVRFAYKQISDLKTSQSKVGAYDRQGRTLHISENRAVRHRIM